MGAERSNFGDLLEPGFRTIFDDRFKEKKPVFTELFGVHASDKMDERDSGVGGFGYYTETSETGTLTYEDPQQLYDVVYVHSSYKKGFKITEEMYDDDQYNVMNRKPAALGRAARRTREYLAAVPWNNAFSTSYKGGDAKPMCSTSHPRADGGSSQSNASATGVTFIEENPEVARLALTKQLDDKGMFIDVEPNVVLHPVDLDKDVDIILNSPGRSGTADRDKNVYQGKYKTISWLYLTSATAWWMLDSELSKEVLCWFNRKPVTFKQDITFDSDWSLYKGKFRSSVGFSDWRGIWGSKGDGSAFSD